LRCNAKLKNPLFPISSISTDIYQQAFEKVSACVAVSERKRGMDESVLRRAHLDGRAINKSPSFLICNAVYLSDLKITEEMKMLVRWQ